MAWAVVAVVAAVPMATASSVTSPGLAGADPVGTVTVYPGDIARPMGITAGPDGNLWFANNFTKSIGRITTTGVVTVFKDPHIVDPTAIASGPDGNLWFTDTAGNGIGRVTPTGAITMFTGAGIASPRGIVGGPDGNVWFTSPGDKTVGRITPAGTVTSFGDPSITSLGSLTVGSDGALWFAASSTSLGRITTDGQFSSFTTPTISSASLITRGADGDVWYLLGSSGGLAHMTPQGVVTTVPFGNVFSVDAMTSGPDGNVWLTGIDTWSRAYIAKVTLDGNITWFSDAGIDASLGLTAGPDGNVWFAATTARTIGRITPAGAVTQFVGAGIASVGGMVTGPDGNLWFAGFDNNVIGRLTPTGSITTYGHPGLDRPESITVGPDGNLWFTNRGFCLPDCRSGPSIGRITTSGAITLFADPGVSAPAAIAAGPDGALWFVNRARCPGCPPGPAPSIGRITTTGAVSTFTDPALKEPTDIVSGPDGNLWFTDYPGNAIGRITPAGAFAFFTDASLAGPLNLTLGADGNLWFTNSAFCSGTCGTSPSIGRMTLAGAVTALTDPLFAHPLGIAAGADGNLWVTDVSSNHLVRVTTSGVTTDVSDPSIVEPESIAPGPGGNVYVSALGSDAIVRVATADVGDRFAPVTPFRLVDSRDGTGFAGPVVGGTSKRARVAGVGSVPDSATAVVMNVTVTGGTAASYLTAYPTGAAVPTAANLVFAPDQTVPNLVTVKLGDLGQVSFFNQLGSVDVVADVVGYYAGNAPDGFTPVTPARVLDSRSTTGSWPGALGTAEARDLTVAGSGGVPADATGVVMDLTVTSGTQASYLQAYPAGTAPGPTANLLFAPGQTVSNLVTVGLGSGGAAAGKVTLFNQQGSVHVVADVVGYFSAGSGGRFHPITPTRLLDDRSGTGLTGPWGPGQVRSLTVTGGVIPVGATAVVGNLTATNGSNPSYLTLFPHGAPRPGTANLLFGAGQTIPAAAAVGVGPSGQVDVFNQLGAVDVVFDAAGYYAPT